LATALACAGALANDAELRVCASDLGRVVRYTWLPNRRGFVRKTLGTGDCDVIIGVPQDFERVRTTRPYYASSYVFVFRDDGAPHTASFDDPAMRMLRVGIPLVAADMATTPPGHALAYVGAIDNVRGFPVDGDGTQGARIVHAVATGELDVGVLWGPQAAFYARRESAPLTIAIAKAPPGLARIPFEYAIAMGVRRSDTALQKTLDAVIERRRADIDAILERYGVPRVDGLRASGTRP